MSARAARQDDSRTPTTVVGNYLSESETREDFSLLIADFTPRQLAKASDCTIDAAKHWIGGRRTPNLVSTINMAQSLPTVRDWVALRCGIERVMQARSWDAWLQGLYAIAAGNGPDALKARWAIARINQRDDDPPVAHRDTATIDIFSRRRG